MDTNIFLILGLTIYTIVLIWIVMRDRMHKKLIAKDWTTIVGCLVPVGIAACKLFIDLTKSINPSEIVFIILGMVISCIAPIIITINTIDSRKESIASKLAIDSVRIRNDELIFLQSYREIMGYLAILNQPDRYAHLPIVDRTSNLNKIKNDVYKIIHQQCNNLTLEIWPTIGESWRETRNILDLIDGSRIWIDEDWNGQTRISLVSALKYMQDKLYLQIGINEIRNFDKKEDFIMPPGY